MNSLFLFKIKTKFITNQASTSGIECFIACENEEILFNYLSDNYSAWGWDSENIDKEKIIKSMGNIDYPLTDSELSESCYGINKYGWVNYGELNEKNLLALRIMLKNDFIIIE